MDDKNKNILIDNHVIYIQTGYYSCNKNHIAI